MTVGSWDADQIHRYRLKQDCKAFRASISDEDVCRLASAYHDDRPCHVFQEPQSGSYNVCFFVEFDAAAEGLDPQRWAVRFPLPSVHNAREKLASEVATMRYVATKTSIPILRDHGYGFGDDEHLIRHCFLLRDFVHGVKCVFDESDAKTKFLIAPTWLTGYEANIIARWPYDAALLFQHLKLTDESRKCPRDQPTVQELIYQWTKPAQAVLIPCPLLRSWYFDEVYIEGLHVRYLPVLRTEMVEDFFTRASTENLIALVKQKVEDLENYQAKVKASGLFLEELDYPPEAIEAFARQPADEAKMEPDPENKVHDNCDGKSEV
ncbi:MAG: hypothetical protein M1825_005733 [Sarcosagium campestre]|nr:MAG: hypothetical protein M1825_005733 [Sarcosagium campestre]